MNDIFQALLGILLLGAVVGIPLGLIRLMQKLQYDKTEYAAATKHSYWAVVRDVGLSGEYLIYKNLKRVSQKREFLFNVYLPKDGKTTEIDVLLLHKTGIYVFESKNYSGWIFGSEQSPNWTQTLKGGRKNKFYNPIMQNRTHIKALQEFLSDYPDVPCHSVIVFSERCTLKAVTHSADVPVINRDRIYETIGKIAAGAADCLDDAQIQAIRQKLFPLTQLSEAEKQQHIANIHKTLAPKAKVRTVAAPLAAKPLPKESETVVEGDSAPRVLCPVCGSEMVKRTAKRGENAGNEFYGCSQYPKCKTIKSMDEIITKD